MLVPRGSHVDAFHGYRKCGLSQFPQNKVPIRDDRIRGDFQRGIRREAAQLRRVVHGEQIEVYPAVIGVENRGENVFVADEAGETRDGFGIGGEFAERVGCHGGI